MKIVVASNDVDKIKQIRSFFKDYEVLSLDDAGINVNFINNGETFAQNARFRATAVSEFTSDIVLGFDSGLTIDVLGGFPGVDTYTFLGDDASDKDRNDSILERMRGFEGKDRNALFTTCIYVIKNNKHFLVTADTEAEIALEPRTKNTRARYFEFDPILVVKDGLTMAEVRKFERNKFSSFYRALCKLKKLYIL